MKHTKGQWKVNSNNQVEVRTDRGKLNVRISQHTPKDRINNEEANAKLIASAPELLEAAQELIDMTEFPEEYHNALNKLEDAIKKATE